MIRHPYADGAPLRVHQHARDFTRGTENEGVGTGRMRLDQAKRGGIHLGEHPDLGQIPAHQGEVVFFIQPAQSANAFDRPLVADQATQGVGRIGGIDDHPTRLDDLHGLFDQAWLRIFRMNLEKLTHDVSLFRGQQ
ncbi:hypothetical protein D9M73_250990 [compost metagenome]